MRVKIFKALLLLSIALCAPAFAQRVIDSDIPHPPREFRAVWIATVANIDWPSKKGLPVEEQKAELVGILDRAKEFNLNAVLLQVRPQCDALYDSKIEPWSEFLSGQMGRAPSPYYDPLKFAVAEAHKRGLELHAWFNPYRALQADSLRPPSPGHISLKRPDLVKTYGKSLWLDPGEPEVQSYSLSVVMDVVRRYDIDGVHFDDYFYPYKVKDPSGHDAPFPDDPSWSKYLAAGGKLSRDDWRRKNVDDFVARVYKSIKATKPYVKFGISPFGIWQPGYPPGIKGFNAYQDLYADSLKWLQNGWVDYFSPQLYWPIDRKEQSYTALLDWWSSNNPMRRHIWPGNAAFSLPAAEIAREISATHQVALASGNILFSAKTLMQDRDRIGEELGKEVWKEPALVPAMSWIGSTLPARPRAVTVSNSKTGETRLAWSIAKSTRPVFLWVLCLKRAMVWQTILLPGAQTTFHLSKSQPSVSLAAVFAVDRLGNAGRPAIVRIRR
jgi:uncharacterized lipoprotein YddW (UPF0748 family)